MSKNILNVPSNIKEVLDDFVKKQVESLGNSVEKIILYGSYARGDYREDSDVDIMILTNISDRKEISRRLHIVYDDVFDYEIDNNVDINPNMQNIDFYKEWLGHYPYYNNIEKDGVVLYEKRNYKHDLVLHIL